MAQEPSSLGPQPDGPSIARAAAPEIAISPLQIGKDVLRDQKVIWTFPARAVRGKHWKPILAIALGTAGLVILDPHVEPYFRDQARFSGYRTGPLRGRNTTLVETLTPVAFYATGLATYSTHARNTGVLAAEALAGAQMVSFVMKQAVGRAKPTDIPPDGSLRDTWFKHDGGFSNGAVSPRATQPPHSQ